MILPILYKIHKQRSYTLDLEEYKNFIDDLKDKLKDKLNDWNIRFYLTPYDYSKHKMFCQTRIIDDSDADNILTYRKYKAIEISSIFNTFITFILFFEEYDDAKECFESICKT